MEKTKPKRGPAPGTGGRPPGTPKPFTPPELLAKAQVLREHLQMPAELTHPARGTRYEAYRKKLSQQLDTPRRLGAWWRQERVQLTDAEIEACWRWLLPQ
jgi:hypothetical protein